MATRITNLRKQPSQFILVSSNLTTSTRLVQPWCKLGLFEQLLKFVWSAAKSRALSTRRVSHSPLKSGAPPLPCWKISARRQLLTSPRTAPIIGSPNDKNFSTVGKLSAVFGSGNLRRTRPVDKNLNFVKCLTLRNKMVMFKAIIKLINDTVNFEAW